MAEQSGLNGTLQTVPELTNGLPRSDSACTFQSYDASSRSSNASTSQVLKFQQDFTLEIESLSVHNG